MAIDCDGYLQLLRQCGIAMDEPAFRALHRPPAVTTTATAAPLFQNLPLITRSTYDIRRPEDYDIDAYWVIEDYEAAYPLALNDPQLFTHTSRTRRHRYDRLYQFRWTLTHIVGLQGPPPRFDPTILPALRKFLKHRLHQPGQVYIKTRDWLRRRGLQPLYLHIPYLIRELGGPTWAVDTLPLADLERAFRRLHVAFQYHAPEIGRRRFPKMLFVVLALLDEFHITPPYEIPWCKTDTHLMNLVRVYNRLEERAAQLY